MVSTPQTPARSVILALAAHGSSDDARCSDPVRRHAQAMRSRGEWSDVACVFWKESPFFRELPESTGSARVVVVPVMTSGGYYAGVVLPRELRLDDRATCSRIAVGPAIGELDPIAGIVVAQHSAACRRATIDPRTARLLLVGHGTERDPVRSGATTRRQAQRIDASGLVRSAHASFLEQAPRIADSIAALPDDAPIVVVPFLIADGGHGADDIPAALGADPGAGDGEYRGRRLLFASAVGEHPAIADLITLSATMAIRTLDGEVD